jgi:hypothetical protein
MPVAQCAQNLTVPEKVIRAVENSGNRGCERIRRSGERETCPRQSAQPVHILVGGTGIRQRTERFDRQHNKPK